MLPNFSQLSVRDSSPQTEDIGYIGPGPSYWKELSPDLHEKILSDDKSPEMIFNILLGMPLLHDAAVVWFSEPNAKQATLALYTAMRNSLVAAHDDNTVESLLPMLLPTFKSSSLTLIEKMEESLRNEEEEEAVPPLTRQLNAAIEMRALLIGACKYILWFQTLRYKAKYAMVALIKEYYGGNTSNRTQAASHLTVTNMKRKYKEGTTWFNEKLLPHTPNTDENKMAYVIVRAS